MLQYSVEGLVNALGVGYTILVYGIGIIAIALSAFAFQFKHRVAIIISSALGQLCWVAYFLLQGDVTSAISCLLCAVMFAVFGKKDQWRWATHPAIILSFIVLLTGVSLLSFKVWSDIFPIMAGIFAAVAYSRSTEKQLRSLSLGWSLSWMMNSIVKAYPVAFASDFFSTVSVIVALYRYRKKNNAPDASIE